MRLPNFTVDEYHSRTETRLVDNGLLHSPVSGMTMCLTLCGAEGIKFKDRHFVPDMTKGYFQFSLSHAFPSVLFYQTALHPAVIAKSYASLEGQNLNYEHQVARYHKTRDVRDRIIGGIAAVDFPRVPSGGWKINPDASQSPSIEGVATVYKQAQGMDRVLGEHVTGKRKYTVSMEVLWPLNESGFAVEIGSRSQLNKNSPEDFVKAGYDYFPFEDAPEDLRATYSEKKEKVVARYKGRKVVVLMGGLNNPVHYAGVGVVQFGAESTAQIRSLAASAANPLQDLAENLAGLFGVAGKIIEK